MFVCTQDALYVNDSPELAALLERAKAPIHIFKLDNLPYFFEAISMPTLRNSLAALGLPPGTDAVASEEATAACKRALSFLQASLAARSWISLQEPVSCFLNVQKPPRHCPTNKAVMAPIEHMARLGGITM